MAHENPTGERYWNNANDQEHIVVWLPDTSSYLIVNIEEGTVSDRGSLAETLLIIGAGYYQ